MRGRGVRDPSGRWRAGVGRWPTGPRWKAYEPFGGDLSQDEIEGFIRQHTGDGMFGVERSGEAEVQMALDKGVPQKMYDKNGNEQNAEEFIYGNTRAIVNYDMPYRSTATKLKGN